LLIAKTTLDDERLIPWWVKRGRMSKIKSFRIFSDALTLDQNSPLLHGITCNKMASFQPKLLSSVQ
jgi:hypothetical protein